MGDSMAEDLNKLPVAYISKDTFAAIAILAINDKARKGAVKMCPHMPEVIWDFSVQVVEELVHNMFADFDRFVVVVEDKISREASEKQNIDILKIG